MDRAFGPGGGHDKRMSSAVIDAAGLRELVSTLIGRGYRVIGPTLSDNAIVLAECPTGIDITEEMTTLARLAEADDG